MSGQAELFPDLFDRVVFFCYPFYLNKNEWVFPAEAFIP
jgi:hypothetical protein